MSTAGLSWFQVRGDRPPNLASHRQKRESRAPASQPHAGVRCGIGGCSLANRQQHRKWKILFPGDNLRPAQPDSRRQPESPTGGVAGAGQNADGGNKEGVGEETETAECLR